METVDTEKEKAVCQFDFVGCRGKHSLISSLFCTKGTSVGSSLATKVGLIVIPSFKLETEKSLY